MLSESDRPSVNLGVAQPQCGVPQQRGMSSLPCAEGRSVCEGASSTRQRHGRCHEGSPEHLVTSWRHHLDHADGAFAFNQGPLTEIPGFCGSMVRWCSMHAGCVCAWVCGSVLKTLIMHHSKWATDDGRDEPQQLEAAFNEFTSWAKAKRMEQPDKTKNCLAVSIYVVNVCRPPVC